MEPVAVELMQGRHHAHFREVSHEDFVPNKPVLLEQCAWGPRQLPVLPGHEAVAQSRIPGWLAPVCPPIIVEERIVRAPAVVEPRSEPQPAVARVVVIAEEI